MTDEMVVVVAVMLERPFGVPEITAGGTADAEKRPLDGHVPSLEVKR